MESFLEVTKYVPVGGCKDVWQERVLRMDGEDGRWEKEAECGAGRQQSDLGNFAQVFLTFFSMSFESPVILHLLPDPVFAVPKMIRAYDRFLAHGSTTGRNNGPASAS